MARNEWINSYLEAILDVGTSNKKRFESNSKIVQKLGVMNRKDNQEKVFSPIKYFVEEVVNSFDESDLYKTWIKVCSFICILISMIWIQKDTDRIILFHIISHKYGSNQSLKKTSESRSKKELKIG